MQYNSLNADTILFNEGDSAIFVYILSKYN